MRNFDEGNENEARRIATSLRIMFHETSRSHSLFKQIKLNHNFFLWSSGELYTPSNLLSSWILLQLNRDKDGLSYKPLGINSKRTFFLSYEDWWNEVIFDDKKNVFTRKDIVTFVANQDGGAHVDKALDGKYAELVKHNSLGWTDGEGNLIVNNPAYNDAIYDLESLSESEEAYPEDLKVTEAFKVLNRDVTGMSTLNWTIF